MIRRVVKMEFREEAVAEFQQLFAERKERIRNFEGCTHLELWQDLQKPHIFFTYSHWISENHLEAYRRSSFFADTWRLTKPGFASPAEAWTVTQA